MHVRLDDADKPVNYAEIGKTTSRPAMPAWPEAGVQRALGADQICLFMA